MEPSWKSRGESVFLTNYFPTQLTIVRGEGSRVFDDGGRSYLDFLGGIAVNSLGHCHPAVVKAIREQCGTLMHVSNLYQHPVQVRLAEILAGQLHEGRIFFCNSGAEANEAAIKLARRHGNAVEGEERNVIVTALGSFHGRTTGALAATGQQQYQKGFGPLMPGFRHVPFGDLGAIEEAVGDDACAVLLEPIQGEGGVVMPPQGYLQDVKELCARKDLLFMLDEVQTGLGRTGSFFAFEADDVRPDVVTLAKALGGGLPLGAMMARGKAAALFQPGNHASTFGGNPVACAASLAMVEVLLGDGFLDEVRRLGDYFRQGLENLAGRHEQAVEVRGRGLLLALELSAPAKPLVAKAFEKGFLINAVQEKVLRFAPPFIVTEEEIDSLLKALDEILAAES